jgi:hypothetical protein
MHHIFPFCLRDFPHEISSVILAWRAHQARLAVSLMLITKKVPAIKLKATSLYLILQAEKKNRDFLRGGACRSV